MEQIKWIETPECRVCTAPREYARRRACMGCEKLRVKTEREVVVKRRGLTEIERRRRNEKIAALRRDGYSYGAIAKMLKMPFATVQSAAKAALKYNC